MREQTTSFIQDFTDPLPVSQENTVRIQHKQYEGLVNAVVKIYDLIADVKSSVGIVLYKPFWFKQCAHDNTGSYTDTFYYEKTLPANNRNTPFYDNSKAIEKRKRKLEATKKIQENTKRKAALMRGGAAGKRGRGAPGPWMRGAPHPGMGLRGRGRGGPGMGMYPGFRPPRAGRMRGFGAQVRFFRQMILSSTEQFPFYLQTYEGEARLIKICFLSSIFTNVIDMLFLFQKALIVPLNLKGLTT